MKNPWAHVRWKGRYSDLDERSWTDQLKTALNYDPMNASSFDNGIFWIDYTSILHYFDVFCMNWNPALFPYTSCLHKYNYLFINLMVHERHFFCVIYQNNFFKSNVKIKFLNSSKIKPLLMSIFQ